MKVQNLSILIYFSFFKVVEKLFKVSSNFASEPTTPAKQWEEFKEIASLVEKVQEIESKHHLC